MHTKVFCYYNLHKKCFSVKALSGPNKGRVIAHSNTVMLSNVQFRVSEAGRQRVLREKRKNVHAGVVGEYFACLPLEHTEHMSEATYNPYKYSQFVDKATEVPLESAKVAYLDHRKVYYII